MSIETMKSDLGPVYAGGPAQHEGLSIAAMMRAGNPEGMTRAEWFVTRDSLLTMIKRIESMSPSCAKCLYLDGAGWCAKWEAKPPAEFKQNGCDEWIHDGVPF